MWRIFLMATALLACSLAGMTRADFIVKNLGVLPGHNVSEAYDINDSGQIVGISRTDTYSEVRAFRYENGTMHDLGASFGDPLNTAIGINASGGVTGVSGTSSSNSAYLYEGGVFTDLGTLNGGSFSAGRALNESGQVVGYSGSTNGMRAFIYNTSTDQMTGLGVLAGKDVSLAKDINSSGVVVGYSRDADASNERAFVWDATNGMRTLRPSAVSIYDTARAINDVGQIVGQANFAGIPSFAAFVYTKTDGMTRLGTLGGNTSDALDINNLGQIVGTSMTGDAANRRSAFLYQDGTMFDLEDLVINDPNNFWDLDQALAINNLGQIVGYGLYQGQRRGFLLTPAPVPEPNSLILLGLVGLGYAGNRWRKRRPSNVE